MSIQYPFGSEVQLGEPIEVCDGVFRVAIPLPGDLVLEHINVWLLADGDGWTLVDTGFDCVEGRQIWSALKKRLLADKVVKRLILTHHHIDHVGLCHWLQQQFQTQVWVADQELQAMQAFHRRSGLWGLSEQQCYFERLGFNDREKRAVYGFLEDIGRGMGPLPLQPQLIQPGQRFQIGGREWQVINLQGHAPDQCTLFCPELSVWIGADQLLPQLSTYAGMEPGELMEIDTLAQLQCSLQRIKQLPEDTLVLPAHGAPFYGIAARADAVWDNYQRLSAQLLKCCSKLQAQYQRGVSVLEIRRKIISDKLFYSSPFFVTAKVASTLRFMANQGTLDCQTDDQGRLLYQVP